MASLARRLQQVGRTPRPRQTPIELPMQSNPARHTADGETRLINCYSENAGREGKTPFPIYACDGYNAFATLAGGAEDRGGITTENAIYRVAGKLLFKIDSSGIVTVIGGVPDEGPCYFSRNRASPQQIFFNSTGGLRYNIVSDVLTEVADADLPPPTSNAFIDGYTLAFIRNGRVHYSSLDDSTAWDANDFFEAEGDADQLVRGFVHNRTIFLFGAKTTELWDSVGDVNNPFQRQPGGFKQFGCLAPASVVSFGDNVALIDERGRVILTNASGATQVISTPAVERSIASLTMNQKALIEASIHRRPGHTFLVISGATFTWQYDGQWSERKSQGEDRWRGSFCTEFAGKTIVGDFEGDDNNGYLYEMSETTYKEGTADLTATIRLPVHAWPNPVSLNRLRVDMVPGVGLNVADVDDADPQLMLRLSKDGGVTYGNTLSRSMGRIGQRSAAIEFSKGAGEEGLGTSNEDGYIVELSCSAAVIRAFTGVSADVKVLRR
jgi:hypothetical protein